MTKFEIGVKVYDVDWFLEYDMSYEEAARSLREWGVTSVLAKSHYLARPDSTVVNLSQAEHLAEYDDHKFRAALAQEGIAYWATVCMFYAPKAIEADPSLRPIGSDGQPMPQIDWYIGLPPTREDFVDRQTAAIERAVRELEPDGIFLSFTRWPGFWELWMPGSSRHDFPEYSYDPHTLDRFVRETGADLPTREPADAAAWIEARAADLWTAWKCQIVTDVVRQIREASRAIDPEVQIMLNTLPFGAQGFDGAQERVFGQRIESLAEVVDVFEVMTYHQILRRPTSWIPQAGEEVKKRSGRKTVCTIQAAPLYLDGIYARDNRSPSLDAEEFASAVEAVEGADVDGIIVFIWSDLQKEVLERNNTKQVGALRAAAARRRARLA